MSGSSGGYCPICGKSYGPEADCCPVHGYLFQSRDALRPGVVIDGAYEILQRLGAGGMGETYLVRHAFLGENLVLKRIRPELAEDPLYQQSFLREAHSLAALRKLSAVVEIRNAWQTREGYLALLLEYVEGGNLLQWLETARSGGPLEVLEAVAITADLAKALAAAHAIGVLHRDVKPQNILMRQLEGGGFQLKLCDFGLAVQRMEEMAQQGTTTTRLGTPGYAAPEQYTLSSREQDARVDVFGLGMTLYRLAAGRLPWEANAASWPLVCGEQQRKSLKELRPALAREYWLESLLLRMTAVERNDRIATASEALELMQEALAETRPASATIARPQPGVPAPAELRQPLPPLPRTSEVMPTKREMSGGTGKERHAESTAGTGMPAGPSAPARDERAPIPIASPEPPIPSPVGLRPSSLWKRRTALAGSGLAVIAVMLAWWLALQKPKEQLNPDSLAANYGGQKAPGNPPVQVEQGNQAPAQYPPGPAKVQGGNLSAQSAGAPPDAVGVATGPAERKGQAEQALWETIKDSRDPAVFEDYLRRYPEGQFAAPARQRHGDLKISAVRGKVEQALGDGRWDEAEGVIRDLLPVGPENEAITRWQRQIADGRDKLRVEKEEAARRARAQAAGGQSVAPAAQPPIKLKASESPVAAPSKAPAAKSKDELAAVQALINARSSPDATIKAAEDLLTRFADTDYKDMALFSEAGAYEQKRDFDKAQVFAERTLEANPKNFQATLMLAELLAQNTRENDVDKEEKLARAETYANQTIQLVKEAAKPNPQIPSQQWEDAKKDLTAEAHNALGLVALTRKKYDVAFTEFKTAVDGAAHAEPAYQVREASALQSAGKNDEAIAICDKIMVDQQVHPQIRQVAQAIRATAIKSGGKNTTAPVAQAAPAASAAPARTGRKP
jgi:serine/threonine protein kinase/tetratricopeptide (TPR) repeat protein